jgi:CheY-like chemotaxis protein
MPEGGRLTVETANCHLDDRYSRLHPGVPAGQYVLIAVTDTGTGMAPEVAAKAFDPFFTTKEQSKGTGLGLSQVYGFVKQSGGHVKVYSEVGQGTTVKIYLPRHYAANVECGEAGVRTSESEGTETVLLVEDDARVLELTAAGLRELGYIVIEARSAREALNHLQLAQRVDLLLTDIVMPEMNGRRLADEAIAMRPDLKVMFMTGFTKNAIVHNGVLDPGVHFLAKPFSLEELSKKLREVLETQRP